MTHINKALAFARECLGWEHAVPSKPNAIFIEDLSLNRFMSLDSIEDFQTYLSGFLGQRFFIQINRGTSSLFKWSVVVGLQDRKTAPPVHDHGRGEGDDMLDAIFDACVAAARLFPSEDANPDA